MKNLILNKSFEFKIEISNSDEIEIPTTEVFDFIEWLQNSPVRYGTGIYIDYYRFDDNFNKDIEVKFKISLK